jgi:hypothetical protein
MKRAVRFLLIAGMAIAVSAGAAQRQRPVSAGTATIPRAAALPHGPHPATAAGADGGKPDICRPGIDRSDRPSANHRRVLPGTPVLVLQEQREMDAAQRADSHTEPCGEVALRGRPIGAGG